MASESMSAPGARPAAARRLPWARWFAARPPRAVAAVMLGETCHLARVELDSGGGRPKLAAVAEGTPAELARWKHDRLFAGAMPLLVLRHAERHVMTLDRPEVADAELAMAVRFPLAEALEAEPEHLLATAVALPRINEAARAQVLAIGSRLEMAQAHLVQLREAGVRARSIDIIDSALRGMALLRGVDGDGTVMLAGMGHDICIGLLWRGDFCALRTLALPVRAPRNSAEFEEHLALHIQRTTDHFERQATALAVRRVVACLPELDPHAHQTLRDALPLPAEAFELDTMLEMSALTREHVSNHNDLTALACVAAARLLDLTPQPAPKHAVQEATA